MSLILSSTSTAGGSLFISPSSEDIDTGDSLSFIEDNDQHQTKSEDQLQNLTPERLIKILSLQGLPLLNKKRECTTEEKIVQVKKGEHILNALKGGKYFVGEPQLMSETAVRQEMQVNYKKHTDGTLEMVNELQLKKQKQVLGHLLKHFGSALFTEKSIMNISLPVPIFESQSQLEREARSLCYAPHFLEKAGNTTNILEQFKLSAAHFIASLHLGVNPQKPFNPIVGETFQGKIGDYPVYVEQISCKPDTAVIQLLGKNFTVEGQTEFTAALSVNSVKSAKVGLLDVVYKNTKAIIRAHYPPGLMSGTVRGKRTFQFTDKFHVFDIENRLYAEISFDQGESSFLGFKKKSKGSKDQYTGGIWKINDFFAEKLKQVTRRSQSIEHLKFKEKEHVVARLENIEGSWVEYLRIGNQVYWSFGELLPYKLLYSQNPLPSDSNYRLDVLYLRAKDEIKSQKNKELIEELERNDRKLRENYKKRYAK